MKKLLTILGMITCMVGLTACGPVKEETPLVAEADAIASGQSIVETLNQIVSQGAEAQYAGDKVIEAALTSWKAAQEDMGSYVGITETTTNISEEEAIIYVTVDGTDHDAVVEIIVDKELAISSITTNVIKTMGEKIVNGALNTLIGMGTVFCILILISLIIACFGIIPKIQKSMEDKKKAKAAGTQETAVDNTIAQIIEKEEQSDDLELVAVIAAAIAASEGQTSTDGFVVRSIRRR